MPPAQRQQQRNPPRRHLRVNLRALVQRLDRRLERLPPGLRIVVELHHRKRHRPADLRRQLAHPRDLQRRRVRVVARHARRRDLVDARAQLAQHPTDPEQLILRRERARHRLAVDRPVRQRARCGKAQRPRLQPLPHDRRHLRDVLRVRVLVPRPALAHHIRPHRAVRHLRADVDRLGQRLQEVQILRERLPAPLHPLRQRAARNVLHALHQADQPVAPIRRRRREAHPAVAHHHRRHPMPERRRQQRIPGDLPVEMRVDIHEAGRDQLPLRVDLLAPALRRLPHDRDQPPIDRHIRPTPRRPRAVHHQPVANHQIMHLSPPRRRAADRIA